MKRYEGLFILETAAKEEGIKDAIDKQRDALFERLGIDDQFAEVRLLFLEEIEDFLKDWAVLGALLGFIAQRTGINRLARLVRRRAGQFLVVTARVVLGRDV